MKIVAQLAIVLTSAVAVSVVAWAAGVPAIEVFLQAGQPRPVESQAALRELGAAWRNGYTSMLVDLARQMTPLPSVADLPDSDGSARSARGRDNPDGGEVRPSNKAAENAPGISAALTPVQLSRQRITQFLEKQTKQKFGDDLGKWRRWFWSQPYDPHPDYAEFKARVYSVIDPRMASFFPPKVKAEIRLDEVDWGGVTVNGIPPLVYPKTVSAHDATYLKDSNIVFGIAVNGEARAYPKRILGWHEMARDRIGGVELTVVYCTLCGTVLPYESIVGGKLRVLGTSGLLYRSNKLMFDEETNSLWSTLEGKPVVGALTGSGLELQVRSSVTTTWKEWREAHPNTTVLSLDTGYKRDYNEGVAYHDYFATDKIMFEVPALDTRLKNKAEVLVALLGDPAGGRKQALAIAADLLRKYSVYPLTAAGKSLVVVTSASGANRMYDAGTLRFSEQPRGKQIADAGGIQWTATEEALTADDGSGRKLPRVPANRAFWFGWQAQFPHTILLK